MALVSDPLYPVVGETVALSITSATGQTEATRFYLGVVPDRSALTTGAIVDDSGAFAQSFVPDVQGAYSIVAYDYRRRQGTVANEIRDELVGTQSGTVYVGAYADLPIATVRGDGATLRLRVVSGTVRAAELIEPLTEVSRYAVKATAVVTKLAAMVGVAVSALAPDFDTDVNDLIVKYDAHIKDGVFHNTSDLDNSVLRAPSYSRASSTVRLIELYDRILAHMGGARVGGTWHDNDDEKNMPVARKGDTLAAATVMKADLRERVYERHRVQIASPASHNSADNVNAMSAPGTLDDFIATFLDELVNAAPSATTGEQEGATDIGRALGFDVQP